METGGFSFPRGFLTSNHLSAKGILPVFKKLRGKLSVLGMFLVRRLQLKHVGGGADGGGDKMESLWSSCISRLSLKEEDVGSRSNVAKGSITLKINYSSVDHCYMH